MLSRVSCIFQVYSVYAYIEVLGTHYISLQLLKIPEFKKTTERCTSSINNTKIYEKTFKVPFLFRSFDVDDTLTYLVRTNLFNYDYDANLPNCQKRY